MATKARKRCPVCMAGCYTLGCMAVLCATLALIAGMQVVALTSLAAISVLAGLFYLSAGTHA